MILRRQAQDNGGTFHLQRHQDNTRNETPIIEDNDPGMLTPSSVSYSSSNPIYHAQGQRDVDERATQIQKDSKR